jgi:hypothetical protein
MSGLPEIHETAVEPHRTCASGEDPRVATFKPRPASPGKARRRGALFRVSSRRRPGPGGVDGDQGVAAAVAAPLGGRATAARSGPGLRPGDGMRGLPQFARCGKGGRKLNLIAPKSPAPLWAPWGKDFARRCSPVGLRPPSAQRRRLASDTTPRDADCVNGRPKSLDVARERQVDAAQGRDIRFGYS